jgi:hypothetical protein
MRIPRLRRTLAALLLAVAALVSRPGGAGAVACSTPVWYDSGPNGPGFWSLVHICQETGPLTGCYTDGEGTYLMFDCATEQPVQGECDPFTCRMT